MRSAEWISIAFFAAFGIAAALLPLPAGRRRNAIGIGVAAIASASALRFLAETGPGSVLRDLAPGLFILMAYWQSGQFFQGSHPGLQDTLSRIEALWFPSVRRIAGELENRPLLAAYLEAAYLMCYPVVPLGVAALYLADRREVADTFWRVVLSASYACYASTALFQTLPPRLVEGDGTSPHGPSSLRAVNLWVLRHGSITANTLPSGHVANSLAIALVLLDAVPVAGVVFLWVAGSITVATAVLRYHYSIDAVLGIGVAILSFLLLR